MSEILTPCLNICVLDAKRDLCRGCGRTRAEIGAWGGMDNETRQKIMDELPARLKAAGLRG